MACRTSRDPISDQELYLSGTQDRFLKIAASSADGRSVSLFTEVTGSLW